MTLHKASVLLPELNKDISKSYKWHHGPYQSKWLHADWQSALISASVTDHSQSWVPSPRIGLLQQRRALRGLLHGQLCQYLRMPRLPVSLFFIPMSPLLSPHLPSQYLQCVTWLHPLQPWPAVIDTYTENRAQFSKVRYSTFLMNQPFSTEVLSYVMYSCSAGWIGALIELIYLSLWKQICLVLYHVFWVCDQSVLCFLMCPLYLSGTKTWDTLWNLVLEDGTPDSACPTKHEDASMRGDVDHTLRNTSSLCIVTFPVLCFILSLACRQLGICTHVTQSLVFLRQVNCKNIILHCRFKRGMRRVIGI